VALLAKDQLLQCTRWLRILSRTWASAIHHIKILQRLASGIDPGLAYQTVIAANEAIDTSSPTSYPSLSTQSKSADVIGDSNWSNSAHPAHGIPPTLQGSNNLTNVHSEQQQPLRDDFGLAQIQSVDAFWNDMPLGENFQRWDQFTLAYFKPSANMAPSDELHQGPVGVLEGNGATPSVTSTATNGMIPPPPHSSYPLASNTNANSKSSFFR